MPPTATRRDQNLLLAANPVWHRIPVYTGEAARALADTGKSEYSGADCVWDLQAKVKNSEVPIGGPFHRTHDNSGTCLFENPDFLGRFLDHKPDFVQTF